MVRGDLEGGLSALDRQSATEFVADSRPLRRDDREDDRVTQRTVAHDAVVTQNTVLFCAQACDRGTGLVVAPVCAELHGDALQLDEGMGQQEQFALRP
jgi:hypothetical protein